MASAATVDDEEIEVVEEESNESGSDEEIKDESVNAGEDAEIVAEVKAGMLANRERVMSAKQATQANKPPATPVDDGFKIEEDDIEEDYKEDDFD